MLIRGVESHPRFWKINSASLPDCLAEHPNDMSSTDTGSMTDTKAYNIWKAFVGNRCQIH